jgi:exopolyphosphatase/guanosine-5'-triphosphate,3'-diphosphate pyrophosphatase
LDDALFALQLLCLRLSVTLCHARCDPEVQALKLRVHGNEFHLSATGGWAVRYPQSAHLLREEVLAWHRTPWTLVLDLL